MKYTVTLNGKKKHVEATRFFCDGRMVVFANDNQQALRHHASITYVPENPAPVAAYPLECVDSIESNAVTQHTDA